MITYKNCAEVTMEEIFEAFSLGFSDYIIPLTMDQDAFAARFFGPEGNALHLSFIVLDDLRPVGLILGGIRDFDGLRTMRCGTMCLGPDYRGQGVSQKLFDLHKAAAADAGCKQLFLEVIKGNDRAIRFYEKNGYSPVYSLKYYSGTVQSIKAPDAALPYTVKEISFDVLDAFRETLTDCHINWQSDTPYYASSTREALLVVYDADRQVAMIAMSPIGKVNFLWVDPGYRNRGLGLLLLHKAAELQKIEKISVCIPSNASLEGFLRKTNFGKDKIEQYEMYMPL